MKKNIIVIFGSFALAMIVFSAPTLCVAADPVVRVSQDGKGDFNGDDETPIRDAIKKVSEQGGGTVEIGPGHYLIQRGLKLPSNITIRGTEKTLLKLASPVTLTAAAKQGQDFIEVSDSAEYAPGTSVDVLPPQGMKTFPDTDKKSLQVEIAGIKEGKLDLSAQIGHPIPKGSRVGYRSNVFFIGGSEKNITIENLTIDGGRVEKISMPGHAQRSAVLAHGIWSYQKGPSAPPIENLKVLNCRIRNCYGRAVGVYSVVKSQVKDCLIEDIADEGIDLDHFCYHCEVSGNTIRRSITGVTINDGSYCIVRDNRIENCPTGVTIWWWHQCPQENLNVENLIENNVIMGASKSGIALGKKCFCNRIISNIVEGKIEAVESDNVFENNTRK